MQKNQFYLTFGKENWNTVQVSNYKNESNLNTPAKMKKQKSHYESTPKTTRYTTSTIQSTNPKRVTFLLQNNYFQKTPQQQPQTKFSFISAKKTLQKSIKYQKIPKQEDSFQQQLTKTNNKRQNYENLHHESFYLFQQKKQPKKKYYPQDFQERNKLPSKIKNYIQQVPNKYQIIRNERKNENLGPCQQKVSQYKQDMKRIDNLLQKVSRRISYSQSKFTY